MKFGPRKPNLKKRVRARTTGKIKRKAKSAVNPFYGKKGTGWVRNPKRAAYNKVYNKTTFDATKGCGCIVPLALLLSVFLITLIIL